MAILLEEGLYTFLSTNGNLLPLLGTRIYPVKLPQGVKLPALTYRRASRSGQYTFGGAVKLPAVRLEITTWHSDYKEVKSVAEKLRVELDGYTGDLGGVTTPFIELVTEEDVYSDEAQLFGLQADYEITVSET